MGAPISTPFVIRLALPSNDIAADAVDVASEVAVQQVPRAHEVSSLGRARQIAAVLARHDLWRLIELFALEQLLPAGPLRPGRQPSSVITPLQVRLALEELGPTFMKLGQVLSTRADLLPKEFQSELSSLQDKAPPIPADLVLETIACELGGAADERFASFDRDPLATGSIGQAHLATLADGTEVVVKVRRPGAVEQIDEDLKLLHHLAGLANHHVDSRDLDLVAIVDEFDASLRAEVDYLHEGHNAERFAENFRRFTRVHVPRIHWDLSTTRVLTMERIKGWRITDASALRTAGIDPDAVATECTRIVLKMLLEDGFFHADLHPGNLYVESEARIGLIDFGMVGVLNEEMRDTLGRMLFAVGGRDCDRLVDSLLELGVASGDVRRADLRSDLEELIDRYYDRALGDSNLGDFLNDVFGVVREHRLVLPSSMSMLAKTLVTAEGMVAELDPSFQMMEATEPYVKQLMIRRNSPKVWAQRFGESAPDVLWLATEGPRIARQLLGTLEKGELAVAVKPKGVDPYLHRFEKTANRIVLGMILSALVVAAAVIVSVYRPVWAGGMLDVVLTGLVTGAILVGVGLLWVSRRKPMPSEQRPDE